MNLRKALTALAVHVALGIPSGFAAIYDDADSVEDLQRKLVALGESTRGIQARADLEGRDLTEQEQAEIQQLYAEFQSVEARLEHAQQLNPNARQLPGFKGKRKVPPAAVPGDNGWQAGTQGSRILRPSVTAKFAQTHARQGWGEFENAADFLGSVMAASGKGGVVDPRLISNAPTTYGQEGTGADGGFAVPPDFRADIMRKILGEESLYALTDNLPTSSNSITVPSDTGAPWAETGIQAHWESEAGQKSQSKPKLGELTAKLNKLTALVPLTDELLEDAPAMAAYVSNKVPEIFNYKLNVAIIRGTGAGQPLGILNSAGTVVVPAESGQVADTVIYDNIVNMWGRLPAESRRHAIWLANADVETQLLRMSFPGSNPPVPVYLPIGGLAATPFATLLGRPVMTTEAMPVLGDQGDLILADMRKYLTVAKSYGIRQDVSMHVWFDYDLTAFRFVLRMTGRPWWNEPIARTGGQASRAFFVALGERS